VRDWMLKLAGLLLRILSGISGKLEEKCADETPAQGN